MNNIQLTHPNPQHIEGMIALDGSKSISNRVLIIQALCGGNFEISRLSTSDDTKVMQAALLQKSLVKDVGAAGTSMRFLTAYLATQKASYQITGSERMKQRPIAVLVDALRALGAKIEYVENEGCPPLRISGGNLQGGTVSINAGVSSQYLSALLMIAPTLTQGLTLQLVGELVSRPYLEMTLGTMAYFGINHQWEGNTIYIAPQKYQAKNFKVEADWSAASYYYAIAALSQTADIQLNGLFKNSWQGDSVLATMMEKFGVDTTFNEQGVRLQKLSSPSIQHFNFDFIKCPDIAQTLAVVAAGLGITAKLSGLSTLSIKETDRTAALSTELAKWDYHFHGMHDVWQLEKNTNTTDNCPLLKTYHDHRMAMAFAPLVLQKRNGMVIENPMVVSKSYPKFWEDLKRLGFVVVEKGSSLL